MGLHFFYFYMYIIRMDILGEILFENNKKERTIHMDEQIINVSSDNGGVQDGTIILNDVKVYCD